jgi:hypothetical protein
MRRRVAAAGVAAVGVVAVAVVTTVITIGKERRGVVDAPCHAASVSGVGSVNAPDICL